MARRGSFLDAMKGLGFQEGHIQILRSTSRVYQYPPNRESGDQSAPFTALVWEGIKLDPEWKPLPGDDNLVEIVNRMADPEKIRPGKLDPKDFDNVTVVPEDMGSAPGAEGNTFYFAEDTARFSIGWGIMQESLEKCAFKAAVLGRGVSSDFEGMIAHFKTVPGNPYIAKQDGGKHKKGDTVTPTNLVCDRIHTFPYDVKNKPQMPPKKDKAGTTAAAGPNGAATPSAPASAPVAGGGDINGQEEFTNIWGGGELSAKFKTAVPAGQMVKRTDFQKALTNELMLKRLKPNVTKAIMDFVKSDEFGEVGSATEWFKVEGDTVTFAAQ